MDGFAYDVRHSLRSLRKAPVITITALLTLTLAIGANTAIFSVIDAVMLRPLPYPHGDRLVSIWEKRPSGQPMSMSTLNFLDYASQNTVFERLAATTNVGSNVRLTDGAMPVLMLAERVAPAYFDVLGIPPAFGRTFRPGDDVEGRDHLVVLSHKAWETQFGSDRAILGRTIHLDEVPYTVIGVMPAGPPFDRTYSNLWVPLTFTAANRTRNAHWLISGTGSALGLLKPGVTLDQARDDLNAIAARIAADHPDTNKGWGVFADRYASIAVGQETRQSLYVLLAAVGLVLLIGCVNLANMMLARGLGRQREIAVKLALGASRARLVRQLLIESMVLSLTGGALGLALGYLSQARLVTAFAAMPAVLGPLPSGVPPEANGGLDARVLAFAFVWSVACGIAVGLAPAFGIGRTSHLGLHGHGWRTTTDRSHGRVRALLVVTEMALACTLFIAAGTLIRSVVNMDRTDVGFDGSHIVTASMPLPEHRFATADAFLAFIHAVDARLQALPGVQEVAFTNALPFQGLCCGAYFQIVGQPYLRRAERPVAGYKLVTAPYFHLMRLRLLKGRTLNTLDTSNTPPVLVINETMSRMYFRNGDPLGQHVLLDSGPYGEMSATGETAYEVVGVAADERMNSFDDKRPNPAIYVSNEQLPDDASSIVIRSSQDPSYLGRSIQAAVAEVDRTQPITEIKTVSDLRSASTMSDRVRSMLFALFAVVALLLASMGIYGVMAYSVGQRRHEMGIRAALGATPARLLALIVGGGLRLTLAGLAIGCVGGLVAAHLLRGFLFGVNAADSVTLVAAALTLAGVSTLASYLPARHAAAADPLEALRAE